MTIWWWTCPPDQGGCADRMQTSTDPAQVERDRDAHLAAQHPGLVLDERHLDLQHWPEEDR